MHIRSCLIQIFVTDLDRSIKWYKDKLGMQLVTKSEKWKSATIRIGGVNFDICQPISSWSSNWIKAKRNIGGLRGIFFYTENIQKTYKIFRSKGVKFLKPPFKTPWGEYKAHFVDLDGNEFSLCEGRVHEDSESLQNGEQMGKIKFSWGKLIIVGVTKELSVGIDSILPGCQTDENGTYLKQGIAIYFVLKGSGLCGKRQIKKGDLLKITAGRRINLNNNNTGNLEVMTIYLPPFNEKNIGYLKS